MIAQYGRSTSRVLVEVVTFGQRQATLSGGEWLVYRQHGGVYCAVAQFSAEQCAISQQRGAVCVQRCQPTSEYAD